VAHAPPPTPRELNERGVLPDLAHHPLVAFQWLASGPLRGRWPAGVRRRPRVAGVLGWVWRVRRRRSRAAMMTSAIASICSSVIGGSTSMAAWIASRSASPDRDQPDSPVQRPRADLRPAQVAPDPGQGPQSASPASPSLLNRSCLISLPGPLANTLTGAYRPRPRRAYGRWRQPRSNPRRG
jgi:hypothetical protein